MTDFKKVLEKLGIEKYSYQIFNSNSKGELFHLEDYVFLSKELKNPKEWFPEWFDALVKETEKTWERPESVFQHIPTILHRQMQILNNENKL